MSIGSFVSTSLDLWNEGKYDISLALACSAIDGTSAKCFPDEKYNNVRYKSFLKRNMRVITTFGMPGISAGGIRIKCKNIPEIKTDDKQMVGIEDIIYHVIRCGLIHQCEIEDRIEFTTQTMLGDFDSMFRIPSAIIMGLVMAVVLTKENKKERLPKDHKFVFFGKRVNLNELWGNESFAAEII